MGTISSQPYHTYKETTKRRDQLFTVVRGRRMRDNGYERFRLQEKCFHCEDSQMVEQMPTEAMQPPRYIILTMMEL